MQLVRTEVGEVIGQNGQPSVFPQRGSFGGSAWTAVRATMASRPFVATADSQDEHKLSSTQTLTNFG